MKNNKIYTPLGVHDILYKECYYKRKIESDIRKMMIQRGFDEIQTPMIEFYSVFEDEAVSYNQENMVKFMDRDGRILVLRPEYTLPVARVISTKLKDAGNIYRIFYIGEVINQNQYGGGKQNEFTQAGCEIVGVNGPEADGEMLACAVLAIKECGLGNFQIDIGQVDFFRGLMEEAGLDENKAEKIRSVIDKKDFIEIEEFIEKENLKENVAKILTELPSLFGKRELLDRVTPLVSNERSAKALANLKEILDIIDDYGLTDYVSVDLGMLQQLNYYTGLICRGFTHGVGFPILSGGRYDNLMKQFGRDLPATGFSIDVNLLMTSMERQNILNEERKVPVFIKYGENSRKDAFKIAEKLRDERYQVLICLNEENNMPLQITVQNKNIQIIYNRQKSANISVQEFLTKKYDLAEVFK